jgi:tape measure domain-containing protein
MTSNIGKFTNAGVKLDDAVAAIQGISNAAALSGANANEASRAMYNFAQALSAGYVKLIDWKSIENANMATVEFKTQLLETAVAAGTVEKTAEGMYRVLTTNNKGDKMAGVIDATHNFNESLAFQWMTTDALVGTLNNYADATTEIGKRAFAAAQDVKTFTQLLDTVKEAVGSGWAKSFELIIGDFDEAKELLTGFNKTISSFVDSASDARNELLTGALASGWKQLVDQGVGSILGFKETISYVAEEHGVQIDKMIEDAGSFEKSLKNGWATSDILAESIARLSGAYNGMTDEALAGIGVTRESADALDELNKSIQNGSVSMEDFAEKIAGASGRELLFESLANVVAALV